MIPHSLVESREEGGSEDEVDFYIEPHDGSGKCFTCLGAWPNDRKFLDSMRFNTEEILRKDLMSNIGGRFVEVNYLLPMEFVSDD